MLATHNRPTPAGLLGQRQQAEALIEQFKSISVLGKWPKNRLLGQVIAANRLVAAFLMSALSPMHSPRPDLRLQIGKCPAIWFQDPS